MEQEEQPTSGQIGPQPRFTQELHGIALSQRNLSLHKYKYEIDKGRKGRDNIPSTLSAAQPSSTLPTFFCWTVASKGIHSSLIWGRRRHYGGSREKMGRELLP